MSWRAIQDTVAISKSLSCLSHGAERLYWRMLAYTDPWGRLEGDPSKVRAQTIPMVKATDAQVRGWLDELQIAGRVRLYHVSERPYVEFVDFESNQPSEFLRRRGEASRFPDPPRNGRLQVTPVVAGSDTETPSPEGEREGEVLEPDGSVGNSDVRRVYDHWRAVRKKKDKRYERISDGRRSKITARLRDFSADELIQALDAVALDPWDDRSRHDDLTVLFKSREQVERFLEMRTNGVALQFVCPVCTAAMGSERALVAHVHNVHDGSEIAERSAA